MNALPAGTLRSPSGKVSVTIAPFTDDLAPVVEEEIRDLGRHLIASVDTDTDPAVPMNPLVGYSAPEPNEEEFPVRELVVAHKHVWDGIVRLLEERGLAVVEGPGIDDPANGIPWYFVAVPPRPGPTS